MAELGYTTAEGLEDWLVTTGKMEDYVEEAELAAAQEAGEEEGKEEAEEAGDVAGDEAGDEGDEASAAGIEALAGYRVFLGNEQWRVRWTGGGGAAVSEESWEVYEVLDTEPLRREADRLRALARGARC